MNGRNITLNGCPMLLPKCVLFRTEHTGNAIPRPNRITLPSGRLRLFVGPGDLGGPPFGAAFTGSTQGAP